MEFSKQLFSNTTLSGLTEDAKERQYVKKSIIDSMILPHYNVFPSEIFSDCLYQVGKEYVQSRNYDWALIFLSASAERDNIRAQIELGDIYYQGEGVPGSRLDLLKESVKYYEMAASNDSQFKDKAKSIKRELGTYVNS